MHAHEADIDEALVRRLLAAQMPGVAAMPLVIVEPWGTDNAVWRLGDDLLVRLPRIVGAEGQVDKEAKLLPLLAPHLSVEVPQPVAVGEPAFGYPYWWAVHRWIDGESARLEGALAAPRYDGPAVWVHADLEANCLVRDGRLCGIVDWNSACLGDPAVVAHARCARQRPGAATRMKRPAVDRRYPYRSPVVRSQSWTQQRG